MKERRQYLVVGYFVDYPDTYGDTYLLGEMCKNVSSSSFVEGGTVIVPEGVGRVAEKFFEEKGWKYKLAEVWVREKK